MDLINSVLNLVVPPASLVILAFAWPALTFINACEWVYSTLFYESMEDKVVIITGASSGIGEQIAYEYAKRKANLVLVARRENRLRGIGDNARQLGAKHVMIMAADVVKEDDCRRFVNETMNFYGRVDHLVNTVSLGHTFYFEEAPDTSVFPILMDINFWGNVYPTYVALPYLRQYHGRVVVNASVEEWLPLPRMSLYSAAKAALVNFYESLKFELKDDVGITLATHGWIGTEMSRGKLKVEEGADMQWKEERELHASGGPVEEYARLIVSGACRGVAYVKFPSWYDIFLIYRVFAPNVLNWTFRLLLANNGSRRTSFVGTGTQLLEAPPPRKLLGSPFSFSQQPYQLQPKTD
ncbi:11beta-hydroxysteroid dehydrogenase [Sarracenia purpurea var. burkii]